MELRCPECGKFFFVDEALPQYQWETFCSTECLSRQLEKCELVEGAIFCGPRPKLKSRNKRRKRK